jgi:hypothetical protein
MTTQAVLTITAPLGGASAARIISLMNASAVPVPPDVLAFYGLRVVTDVTSGAGPVTRVITLGFNPVSAATATSTLLAAGDSGSPVKAVTLSGAGSGYVAPPIVTFTGGRPGQPVQEIPFIPAVRLRQSLGIGTPAQGGINQFHPQLDSSAAAVAYLKVVSAAVVAGGSGYSAATKIVVTGQLKSVGAKPSLTESPNVGIGVAAVLTPTIGGGGAITGVSTTFAGSGYVGVPVVTVVDPAVTPGTGALIGVSMGVGEILMLRGGTGYDAPPSVVLTPLFQALFPAGASPFESQEAPLFNLMNTVLEQAISSPVSSTVVVS